MANRGDEERPFLAVGGPALGGLDVKVGGLGQLGPVAFATVTFAASLSLGAAAVHLHGVERILSAVAAAGMFIAFLVRGARALGWAGGAERHVRFRRQMDETAQRRKDIGHWRSVRQLDEVAHNPSPGQALDPDCARKNALSAILEQGAARLGFERDGRAGIVAAEMCGKSYVIRDIGGWRADHLIGKHCPSQRPVDELLANFEQPGEYHAIVYLDDDRRFVIGGFATFEFGEHDEACIEETAALYQLVYHSLATLQAPSATARGAPDADASGDEAGATSRVLDQVDALRAEVVALLPEPKRRPRGTERGLG